MPAFNIAVRGDGPLGTVVDAVRNLVADVLAEDGQVANATVHAEDEGSPERVDVDLTPGSESAVVTTPGSTSNDSEPDENTNEGSPRWWQRSSR